MCHLMVGGIYIANTPYPLCVSLYMSVFINNKLKRHKKTQRQQGKRNVNTCNPV